MIYSSVRDDLRAVRVVAAWQGTDDSDPWRLTAINAGAISLVLVTGVAIWQYETRCSE